MAQILAIIKARGPISAGDLAMALGLSEKEARGRIDNLRASGEPVWLDVERGFWWANDLRPSGIAHIQWKRPFVE